MDYQFVNEVRSFWDTLFLPLILGVLTIFLFWWILDRKYKQKIYDFFLKESKNNYVLQNGIFLPQKLTRKEQLKNKLIEYIGIKHKWPIISIFLLIVVMFGMYKIIIQIFLPRLVSSSLIILSCEIDDYSLAYLWRKLQLNNINDLYYYVIENSDEYKTPMFLYTLEAYLRLWTCILLIALLSSRNKVIKRGISNNKAKTYNSINEKNTKKEKMFIRKRILLSFVLISFMLIIVYSLQIRVSNHIFRNRFYIVYTKEREILYDDQDDFELYYEKVKSARNLYNESRIPYKIKSEIYDAIKYILREITRYCE